MSTTARRASSSSTIVGVFIAIFVFAMLFGYGSFFGNVFKAAPTPTPVGDARSLGERVRLPERVRRAQRLRGTQRLAGRRPSAAPSPSPSAS